MGKFLHTIKRWVDKAYYGSGVGYDAGLLRGGYGKQDPPNTAALIKEFRGTVYACANANAQGVLKADYHLYQKVNTLHAKKLRYPTKTLNSYDTKSLAKRASLRLADHEKIVEVTSHPLLTLFKRPNPKMDWITLLEFTQLFQEVAGAAYWYTPKNALGIPGQILLMMPQYVTTNVNPLTNEVIDYKYGFGGEQKTYPADEVIPFLLPNLCNGNDGYSPAFTVYDQINVENRYISTETAMLDNEGRPSMIASVKDGTSPEMADRSERDLNNKLRKVASGGILVTGDDVDFTNLSYNPRDLSRLEIHDHTRESICIAYGVPTAMLKGDGGSQYAVHATILLQHVETAITPRLRRNCSTINHFLMSQYDDSGELFIAYDDPSPRNEEMELAKSVQLVAAGIKLPNEDRIERGLEPKPWGDLPAGMYSQDATGAQPEDTATQATDADPAPTDEGVESAGGTPSEPAPEVTPETQVQSELLGKVGGITGVLAIFDKLAAGAITRETAVGLIVFFFHVSKEEAEALVGESGDDKPEPPKTPLPPPGSPPAAPVPPVPPKAPAAEEAPKEPPKKAFKGERDHLDSKTVAKLQSVVKTYFQKQRKSVLGRLEKGLAKANTKALPSEFVPLDEWDDELYSGALPLVEIFFRDNYENQKRELVQRTGVSPDKFNVTNPKLKKTIEKQVLEFAKSTNDTTTKALNDALDDLKAELSEGLLGGDDIRELTKRVGEVFDKADDYRCERIARTEANKAHNEAHRQAAKDSGVVNALEWLTSSDACPLCDPMNGKRLDLDDGDLPPLHPNCECTTLSIIDIADNEGDEGDDE